MFSSFRLSSLRQTISVTVCRTRGVSLRAIQFSKLTAPLVTFARQRGCLLSDVISCGFHEITLVGKLDMENYLSSKGDL